MQLGKVIDKVKVAERENSRVVGTKEHDATSSEASPQMEKPEPVTKGNK